MSKDWSSWYGAPSAGKVQCKACNLVFAKKVCCMFSHLGYEGASGARDRGISLCPRLTSQVQSLFRQCKGVIPRRGTNENVDGNGTIEAMVVNDAANEGPLTPLVHLTPEDSCTIPEEIVRVSSRVHPSTQASDEGDTEVGSTSRPLVQRRIGDGFEEANRRKLHAVWANFFYAANIPFAVARNPAFKEAVKKTAEFQKPYTPPSYHELRHKLLDQAKADIKVNLQKRTEDSIRKFGATLSFDGWTSVSNRH